LTEDRQRIDKWLWHARVVRTRSAAADLAASGHVRVNGLRIDAASRPVKPGDVITVALDRKVRVMRVTGFVARRGSADIARELYDDLAQPDDRPSGDHAASPFREAGSGRPTKRERRLLERFLDEED
jgi:ribosome-associated heat shock protein Hsp15